MIVPRDSVIATVRRLKSLMETETTIDTDELPKTHAPRRRRVIMYIEEKPGLAGHVRIGRVTFSGTCTTLYYAGCRLQSLKGAGYKAN